jgi:nicotinamide riboside kinase
MKIAILGPESTGKTQLAQSLSAHWNAQGQSALWVPEVLREWCNREGRTPQPHEQSDICREQAARVLQASAVDWLIADTTPLMTAIYSELLFADCTLYDFALEHQRHYDLTLVMGLDLPWVADGLQRDGAHVREPVDRLLRAALDEGGLAYQVIHGSGEQRTAAALDAIAQRQSSRV